MCRYSLCFRIFFGFFSLFRGNVQNRVPRMIDNDDVDEIEAYPMRSTQTGTERKMWNKHVIQWHADTHTRTHTFGRIVWQIKNCVWLSAMKKNPNFFSSAAEFLCRLSFLRGRCYCSNRLPFHDYFPVFVVGIQCRRTLYVCDVNRKKSNWLDENKVKTAQPRFWSQSIKAIHKIAYIEFLKCLKPCN